MSILWLYSTNTQIQWQIDKFRPMLKPFSMTIENALYPFPKLIKHEQWRNKGQCLRVKWFAVIRLFKRLYIRVNIIKIQLSNEEKTLAFTRIAISSDINSNERKEKKSTSWS